MRRHSRSLLLVTVLLLVTPAAGLSCELASALCGPEGASASGVKAPPCHGTPDTAMDCCSVQAPTEAPPATSLGDVGRLVATICPGLATPEAPASIAAGPATPSLAGAIPASSRYALFSTYLL